MYEVNPLQVINLKLRAENGTIVTTVCPCLPPPLSPFAGLRRVRATLAGSQLVIGEH